MSEETEEEAPARVTVAFSPEWRDLSTAAGNSTFDSGLESTVVEHAVGRQDDTFEQDISSRYRNLSPALEDEYMQEFETNFDDVPFSSWKSQLDKDIQQHRSTESDLSIANSPLPNIVRSEDEEPLKANGSSTEDESASEDEEHPLDGKGFKFGVSMSTGEAEDRRSTVYDAVAGSRYLRKIIMLLSC
jgi:hypothetical protein